MTDPARTSAAVAFLLASPLSVPTAAKHPDDAGRIELVRRLIGQQAHG